MEILSPEDQGRQAVPMATREQPRQSGSRPGQEVSVASTSRGLCQVFPIDTQFKLHRQIRKFWRRVCREEENSLRIYFQPRSSGVGTQADAGLVLVSELESW